MSYESNKKAATEALAEINPWQPYGTELFNAISRVSIGVPIETVAIRQNPENGKIEVLLTQRGPDEAYPGQWHSPGSFLRIGEEIEDVFRRLEKREFGVKITRHEFVGFYNTPFKPDNIIDRGQAVQLIFLVAIEEEGSGTWFAISELPEPIVENHQQVLIPRAVEAFLGQPKIRQWICPFCGFRMEYPEPEEGANQAQKDTFQYMWDIACKTHFRQHMPEKEG